MQSGQTSAFCVSTYMTPVPLYHAAKELRASSRSDAGLHNDNAGVAHDNSGARQCGPADR